MTSADMIRHDMSGRDEVLTLSETAAYLKIAARTIHRMIQRNEIPCARVGGQWRFVRSVLDDWLLSRMQVGARNEFSAFLESSDGSVPLAPLVQRDFIVDDIEPGTQEHVLTQLARPLAERKLVGDVTEYVRLLLARERLSSTALGYGVAVPRVRRPSDNPAGAPAVLIGVCRQGTAYGTVGDEPIHFFFLLGPTSELIRLGLLKRISYLFRDRAVGAALLASERERFLDVLTEHEARVFAG